MAGEPGTLYASPNGSGWGTRANPYSLSTALTNLSAGQTLVLLDGIYSVNNLNLGSNYASTTTIQADTGARPILATADGKCSAINVGGNCVVDGLWFGGLRDEAQTTQLAVSADNVTIRNCTFFNYYQAIGEGSVTGCVYQGNRFVNCGQGTLNHTIYISSGAVGHVATLTENILIGGEAYQFHLWNNPINTTIQYNFSGGANHCLALQGTGHTIDHNIFWKAVSGGAPLLLTPESSGNYTGNYHGPIGSEVWMDGQQPAALTMSGNYYYTGTSTFDPSPTRTVAGDEVTYLGDSAANIDVAISALETAFTTQTLQQIHDDSNINTNFATLKAVIDTWKA